LYRSAHDRKDTAALEEISGLCGTSVAQFWVSSAASLKRRLKNSAKGTDLTAEVRRKCSAVLRACTTVSAVSAVAPVASAAVAGSSSADNSSNERENASAGARLSTAAQRKKLGQPLHKAVKPKAKALAAAKATGKEVDRSSEAFKAEARLRAMQHQLTAVMDGLLLDQLLDECSAEEGARLRHCAMPDAWLWLLVRPMERCYVLNDREMCAALRHQYGLPPKADATWYCRCGEQITAGHLHTCERVHGPATFARHETIVSELCAVAQTCLQLRVVRSPVMSYDEHMERAEAVKAKRKHLIPDILFAGADLSVCTDVTVLLGEAKSRLQCAKPVEKAHMRLRKACKTREREKKRKYDESCKQMDAKFEPFVVESHGFLAAGAVQLLDQLAGYGAEVLCLPFPELKGHLKRRLAIAVQRGNAALDAHGIQACRNSYGSAVARGMVQPLRSDAAASASLPSRRSAAARPNSARSADSAAARSRSRSAARS
jgi:hypothetical protein